MVKKTPLSLKKKGIRDRARARVRVKVLGLGSNEIKNEEIFSKKSKNKWDGSLFNTLLPCWPSDCRCNCRSFQPIAHADLAWSQYLVGALPSSWPLLP